MKKIIILSAIFVMFVGACTAGVGKKDASIVSFEGFASSVNWSLNETSKYFTFTSPDEQVVFALSSNFSLTTPYDYVMEIDATPFINAGLDITKLPEGMFVDNKIVLGYDLSTVDNNEENVVSAFEAVFNLDSSLIGYHAALDHYGLNLGNGNMFEWAKDFTTNDKDIVYVLNPQLFADAGVNLASIDGWILAEVEVDRKSVV